MTTDPAGFSESKVKERAREFADAKRGFAVLATSGSHEGCFFFPSDLVGLSEEINPTKRVVFISHRKFLGPLIALAKTVSAIVAGAFIRYAMVRQRNINAWVMLLAQNILSLEKRNALLEKRVDELAKELEALSRR